jgi:hypothetical protein
VDKALGLTKDDQEVVWYKGRICVSDAKEIREMILREAHESAYSIHLGTTKMYEDLKSSYM